MDFAVPLPGRCDIAPAPMPDRIPMGKVLDELRDAYPQAGEHAMFQAKLAAFRERYARRSAMMRRIENLRQPAGHFMPHAGPLINCLMPVSSLA